MLIKSVHLISPSTPIEIVYALQDLLPDRVHKLNELQLQNTLYTLMRYAQTNMHLGESLVVSDDTEAHSATVSLSLYGERTVSFGDVSYTWLQVLPESDDTDQTPDPEPEPTPPNVVAFPGFDLSSKPVFDAHADRVQLDELAARRRRRQQPNHA